MSEKANVTLSIFGQTLNLRCEESEVADLKAAAATLNKVAQELTGPQAILDRDKLAILVGLTLANELNRRQQETLEFLSLSEELSKVLA